MASGSSKKKMGIAYLLNDHQHREIEYEGINQCHFGNNATIPEPKAQNDWSEDPQYLNHIASPQWPYTSPPLSSPNSFHRSSYSSPIFPNLTPLNSYQPQLNPYHQQPPTSSQSSPSRSPLARMSDNSDFFQGMSPLLSSAHQLYEKPRSKSLQNTPQTYQQTNKKPSQDAKEEKKRRLQKALADLNNGTYKNIHSAASAHDVNYNSLKNAFYKINGRDENSQRLTTSERERRISRAINGFRDGKYSNLTEASKMEKVCAETVRNRYHGRTQSFSDAKKTR
ncbi:hypothetical protein DASC09_043880 [Saccharomycopsis crataegensis]|uniref:Uncharacterized protein n=1 Tax=Saccharomycopsis crataegensis TaxID=43959 RepID=A0AAV5QSE7_9ASCO|nr:hypothetical protein DASC09_043880 [Saccharomycopsis crataegensis]